MKYIDADKLKAEIKRLEEMDYPCDTFEQSVGFYEALDCIKSFIDSLLQEQPEVDLEKEIKEEYLKHRCYGGRDNMLVILNEPQFNKIAKRFIELSRDTRKE